MTSFTSKTIARHEAMRRLRRLDELEKRRASAAIRNHLENWPVYQAATCVLFFAGLSTEPDLLPLATISEKDGTRSGKSLCFPRVDGTAMDVYSVPRVSELVSGRFGILEPDPAVAHPISIGSIDLVLAPGLAFGLQGERLGRGGGYFDRFLSRSEMSAQVAGICFGCQVFEVLPIEKHDVPMDFVVTEAGVKGG